MLYKEILGHKRESSLSNPNGVRERLKAKIYISSLQFTQTSFYITHTRRPPKRWQMSDSLKGFI